MKGLMANQLRHCVGQGLKRRFDLVAAMAALIALAPVFLVVALAIKLEDRGPVFFRQTRIGHRGQPFKMWKFRSMVRDAEARLAAIIAQSERDGTCFKMRSDPRITKVGAFLRRFSLDELPQLFNIVAGDMSVVGPRPALPREVLTYAPEQRERLIGLPGLTCTWQVSGRAEIPFEQQVLLDVEYLRTRSFVKDMGIIVRTIPAVLNADGAY
jgi:lipopolysaccharide/colanic/teichoic acid biosynthesis glycosyltransferase